MAYVQAGASIETQRLETAFPVPELGSLHGKFLDLPLSCEVLVQVAASSINPADRKGPGPYPQVLGSDLAGTVLRVEDSCHRLRPGDKVWADIGAVTRLPGSHSESKGKENGAYGQVAVALESQLGTMPKSLDFSVAASLPKVALTSYKALRWYGGAPYHRNDTAVLILGGSGGTGTTGIQLAHAWGAANILTTTSASNKAFCESLGASRVINYHQNKWWEVLPNQSVDVVYDTVGEDGTADHAMHVLRPGGFFVTIAGKLSQKPRADVRQTRFINSDTNLDNVPILDELRGLVDSGQLGMPQVKVYALQDIQAAFNESAAGRTVGKIGIRVPASSAVSEL